MIFRLLVPAVLLLACSKAAVVQRDAEPACPDSAANQGAMTVCSGDAFKSADRRLNELVGELRGRLPRPQLATLDSAEEAWSSYAAAQCRLENAASESGSAYSMKITQCRRGLTERRIKELAPLLCAQGASGGAPCPAAERYTKPQLDPVPQ